MRTKSLELVKENVKNKNLIKHMLATEAVMRKMAVHFNEDAEKWAMAGLVHDLDVEITQNNTDLHSAVAVDMLKEKGYSEEIINAVRSHFDGKYCKTLMDRTIRCVDPLTGFLVACALMTKDKKLSSLDVSFALRRFEEKRFAAGASREGMKECEEVGLTLEQFMDIGIKAMQEISEELGL
ncbi:MAG: HD domain-containing protein [Armatimonadota bacterium]